jgi:intraflagellar transport protein 88
LDSDCIKAIYNQGIAYYAIGNYKDALNYYLEAHKHIKDDTDILYDIAHCYYKLKDLDNSIYWGNEVLKIDAEHGNAIKLVKNVSILNNRSRSKDSQ